MSDNFYREFIARVLDPKSSSFCGAKWYNATIWLGSGMTTSCHHPLPHHVSVQDVEANPRALHNTPQKKSERRMMQNGERPSGCEYCWKIEDIGRDNLSDRVYKSIPYSEEDLIYAYNLDSEEDVNLQTLEISFDRTCQFACSYCNPAFSSTWVKDIKRNGAYEGLVSDGRNHFTHPHDSSQLFKLKEVNPYVEAFFKWWETDLHKTLQELRITGGEPLMSGYTWKLLEWFEQNRGKSNTRLAINSNLGVDKEDLHKLLDSCGDTELHIYTSNESVGAQAEYIRDGLDWDQWIDNMHLLASSGKVAGLHLMCTINALCLEGLTDLMDLMIEFKKQYGRDFPTFTLNILRFPSFQSPTMLPDDIKKHYHKKLKDWYDQNLDNQWLHQMELDQLSRLIDYIDVVKSPHKDAHETGKLQNDFAKFYQQYDSRRNKDFENTFPLLKDLYNVKWL